MRVVDPNVAYSMLHREAPATQQPFHQQRQNQYQNQRPRQQLPVSSAKSTSAADEEKNQAEMLLKVINLTDEQINFLPPDDRAKVLELRNQLRVKMSNS